MGSRRTIRKRLRKERRINRALNKILARFRDTKDVPFVPNAKRSFWQSLSDWFFGRETSPV